MRQRLAVSLFCGLFVLQAVAAVDDFDGSSYARNVSLDTNVDIFWTVDLEAETIRVAVHAKAATGWAGVGISEMGGMEGADIVFYETATGNLTDAYSLVAGTPVVDECTQDWTLLSAEVGDGSLVFEAERALDTGDDQDRVFSDDSFDGAIPTRVLTAWGDSDTVGYHGENFAKGQVVMFGGSENDDAADPVIDVKTSEDVQFFDAAPKNFSIPTVRTWYENTCITASELPDLDEYHAIAFEGLLQADTAEYVHHLILTGFYGASDCGKACSEWLDEMFASEDGSDSSSTVEGGEEGASSSSPSGSSYPSDDSSSVSFTEYFENLNITVPSFCSNYGEQADIFVWAPGTSNLELPGDVGFLLGNESGGFNSLNIQTHYNNPDGVSGKNDSSGVRVYYTEELRPIQMGVLKLGDPFIALSDQPLPDGKSSFSFGCPGTCSETNFEEEEVTIFNHVLHMHENGQRMVTHQYRDDGEGNEELIHTTEVWYYSSLQAGAHVVTVNGSATIKKGDSFTTQCMYDTSLSSVGSANVTFGLGSEQEMCVNFIFYYPDQRLPDGGACGVFACDGGVLGYEELEADSDFNRTFGIVDTCTSSLSGEEEGSDSSSSSRAAQPLLGPLFAVSTIIAALSLEIIMA
ncbi:conserved unknown protein [Ectocarpus siliculosus]|uniref:DOMON domain-containing protein n=1 Tax=Ectocarpus siliculosus TaxID=2880 RepID=D7G216_ECTSI|nr:conserved unknown protein [Ectocarpus siliculosus]|eukprot:CBJ33319.1 conserved unknown protein [Ectocarpus siliculosus]